MNTPLNTYLSQFAHEQRIKLLQDKLLQRTKYITVCLEDIYQSQNASAVIRTCEAFGIQNIHIIEDKHQYSINPMVVKGSTKWLNLYKHNESPQPTLSAINKLKTDGYRIVATSPHGNNTSLENFDLSKGKVALMFGTELSGISDIVKENADEFLTIPMFGFVESFNISVSAAIILHTLTMQLRQSDIEWKLDENEQSEIMLQWLKATIKNPDVIIDRYNQEIKNSDL